MDETVIPEPTLEKQLRGHKNCVTAVNFSPNEQLLASSSLDNSVLLWNLRGTIKSYRFNGHSEAITDVQFSPTSKYMVSCSRDKTVRVWVPTVTGSVGMFKAHSQTVRSVQFTSDGTKLLTASDDKIVKLWSSDKHKFLSSFVGHTNWVRCAQMSNDCKVIASCSDDKTVRLWNPDGGECIHTYKIDNGHGYNLAWHPSGCYVGVCTTLGNLKMFDIRTHKLVQYYSIHTDVVTQLSFHPSGSYIITASKDGKMKILDLLEGHPIFTLSGHNGAINSVSFSPTGTYFASGGDDKVLMIWNTKFTEVDKSCNENNDQNNEPVHKASSEALKSNNKKFKQGTHIWSQCYHGTIYPDSTFVHLDDIPDSQQSDFGSLPAKEELPNTPCNSNTELYQHDSFTKCLFKSEVFSLNVGDISHIPRRPPTPATYVVPTLGKKQIDNNEESLFGMISLKNDDVCYTSGTIEWVGRKRSYPLNSGFKVLREGQGQRFGHTEPGQHQQFDHAEPQCVHNHSGPAPKISRKRVNNREGTGKDCDCADVLPTVNTIVDHLNVLHEAVDLVDLRLNNIEDAVGSCS